MKIEIHGHRGSRGTHPENTIAGFQEAADCGADFVELDVHLTRDQQLVVFHDFEIKSAGVATHLGELSLREIREIDPGVPSLTEVIQWRESHARKLRLNVEIKRDEPSSPNTPSAADLVGSAVELLRKNGILGDSLIQSFDNEVVRLVRTLAPNVLLSHLFEPDEINRQADIAQLALDAGAQIVAPHFSLVTEKLAARARELGIGVLPWTVNQSEDWQEMIRLGVRGIITDFPRRLIDVVGAGS